MRYSSVIFILGAIVLFVQCTNAQKRTDMDNKKNNPYYSLTDTKKLDVSDQEWKEILPREMYYVAREEGTERAFTGKHVNTHEDGTFHCAVCGNALFDSETKYDSGSGWPSFYQPVKESSVQIKIDRSHGMVREEVECARCGSHLGHVFDDGPQPTGKRYCMNSAVLEMIADKKSE